jgi:regulator of RNase E activity RraA
MDNTTDEKDYFDKIAKILYTAVVHDVLDELGYHNQALPPELRPLTPETRVVGRAATMRAADVLSDADKLPFGFSLQFLESLTPGEVVVGTAPSTKTVSLWGEIMSTAAAARGSRGVILDGYGRDASFIKDIEFPSFFTGLTPAGSVGRLQIREVRIDIQIGGVDVHNGDLVFGDFDGCIVIPQAVEAEAIKLAFEKVAAESQVREELRSGASIIAMYEKYGVL